jgi:exosortase A-associated hydrolase 2
VESVADDADRRVETPLFFGPDGARLFGVWHEPRRVPSGLGVVWCAPFAEEATISQRVSVDLARVLADRGHHVLRFDYRGCGDSEGEFAEAGPADWLEDVRSAVELLRRRAGVDVGLAGLRLGASMAASVAWSDPAIRGLILWEPIVHFAPHVKSLLRAVVVAENALAGRAVTTRGALLRGLEAGEVIDLLGYPLSPRCLNQLNDLDPLAETGPGRVPTLVVGIGRQRSARRDFEELAAAYRERGRQVELVAAVEQRFWTDPGDPWREHSFWADHEGLFALTADWLERLS